ncbi:MAG: M48 family metalloprotease [Deltaproteobacteria bacterium]|nr:M48 family metalloprotease [Deltaproteobacteria bacterium]
MNKLLSLSLILTFLSLIGCTQVDIGGVTRVVQQTFEAARPLSDEEEYYVGRSVAARILSSYSLLQNQELTEYVNLVGNTVALNSDKPYTYGGYHFAILNSKEINAFACPGGTIFITKGMINAVRNEDELAAVLAHEVAHVNHRDGVSAIQKARLTAVAALIGTQAAQRYTPAQLSQLVTAFEGSIDDVFKTLVVNGYGKSQEYHADEGAISYLTRAGYNPSALKDFLQRLVSEGGASGGGIMKSHPATAGRIEKVEKNLSKEKADPSLVQLRARRFEKALK